MKGFIQGMTRGCIALVLAGFTAAAAWAAIDSAPAGSSAQNMMSGKIASIDSQHNLLRVKTGLFKQTDFVLNDSSKISDGSNDIKAGDLKPGDKVHIAYEDSNGEHVVRAMTVNTNAQPQPESTASSESSAQKANNSQPSGSEPGTSNSGESKNPSISPPPASTEKTPAENPSASPNL